MDWCTVEWPPRNQTHSKEGEKKKPGRKALLAGFIGLMLILLLGFSALGYALWKGNISVVPHMARAWDGLYHIATGQKPVVIEVDGKIIALKTKGNNVQEVISEQGIVLGQEDQVNPALSALISKDMHIKVVRVSTKKETLEVPLLPVTKRIPNPDLPSGITRQIQAPREGLEKQTWRIRYEDGVEVSRNCVAKEVLIETAEGVIQYGTQGTISRGGQNLRFSRALDMVSTAYTYTGYNTATGVSPGPGVVAVDPRVIPLGTRLYVDGYGKGVALDTGGLIKGNKVDLFYETEEQAINWGVRKTRVYILE